MTDATTPSSRPVGQWAWLGRVAFARAAAQQEEIRRAILDGRSPETLLLLEHPAVITLGRSADTANVLFSESTLAAEGIEIARASRGGDVTYHGPGQLVGYPIVSVRKGVRAHVKGMASAIINVLSSLGIDGHYRDDAPGVWVTRDGLECKIAAFGINVHKRIAVHGFAFNLRPAMAHFSRIVPCGLAAFSVVSVEQILGSAPTPEEIAPMMARALSESLDIDFTLSAQSTLELLCGPTSLE